MKRYLFLIFMLLTYSFANAQDNKADSTKTEEAVRPNIIKVNPLSFIYRGVSASFEHRVNNKGTIMIGINYVNWNDVWDEGDDIRVFCTQLSYRFYFSRTSHAPEGLFIAPIMEVGNITVKSYTNSSSFTQEKETVFLIGAGFRGGYQWVFKSGVSLDLFAGYSTYFFENSNNNNFGNSSDNSLALPVGGIRIGYNF